MQRCSAGASCSGRVMVPQLRDLIPVLTGGARASVRAFSQARGRSVQSPSPSSSPSAPLPNAVESLKVLIQEEGDGIRTIEDLLSVRARTHPTVLKQLLMLRTAGQIKDKQLFSLYGLSDASSPSTPSTALRVDDVKGALTSAKGRSAAARHAAAIEAIKTSFASQYARQEHQRPGLTEMQVVVVDAVLKTDSKAAAPAAPAAASAASAPEEGAEQGDGEASSSSSTSGKKGRPKKAVAAPKKSSKEAVLEAAAASGLSPEDNPMLKHLTPAQLKKVLAFQEGKSVEEIANMGKKPIKVMTVLTDLIEALKLGVKLDKEALIRAFQLTGGPGRLSFAELADMVEGHMESEEWDGMGWYLHVRTEALGAHEAQVLAQEEEWGEELTIKQIRMVCYLLKQTRPVHAAAHHVRSSPTPSQPPPQRATQQPQARPSPAPPNYASPVQRRAPQHPPPPQRRASQPPQQQPAAPAAPAPRVRSPQPTRGAPWDQSTQVPPRPSRPAQAPAQPQQPAPQRQGQQQQQQVGGQAAPAPGAGARTGPVRRGSSPFPPASRPGSPLPPPRR